AISMPRDALSCTCGHLLAGRADTNRRRARPATGAGRPHAEPAAHRTRAPRPRRATQIPGAVGYSRRISPQNAVLPDFAGPQGRATEACTITDAADCGPSSRP